jgi:hypothetical protein
MNRLHARLLGPATCLLAIASCVADEPTIGDTTSSDASTDSASAPDGSTTDAGIGDGSSDTSVDAGPDYCTGQPSGCPTTVDPTHLKLWLRADDAVDCSGEGRVTRWHDLSGNGRDATPATFADGGNALAPKCGVDTINGHGVLTFDRPAVSQSPYLDETLQVDLSFLASTSFTIFIVHQPTFTMGKGDILLSANAPQVMTGCPASGYNDQGLGFGINGLPDGGRLSVTYDSNDPCSSFSNPFNASSSGHVDQLAFGTTTGHQIKVSGTLVYAGDGGTIDLLPIADVGLKPGAIGRAPDQTLDSRYLGKIAEIVIYDEAPGTATDAVAGYLTQIWNL